MRKLFRLAMPPILRENGERWNKQWKDLKTRNPAAQFQWYQHENRSVRDWILSDLRAMTASHCAFCDRFTVEPESVEHFRPKSDARFLDLAYAWTNLFYCCGGCQQHKREQWDDDLLNPTDDDYVFEAYFDFDFTNGALLPNPQASPDMQRRARVTIEMYGLDTSDRRRFRLLELRRWQKCEGMDLDEFAYRDFVKDS